MILVDSSIWIDHIRAADDTLSTLISRGEVLTHPFIVGEVALGSFVRRQVFLASLQALPSARRRRDR